VGNKWGYANPEGKIIIAPKYQEANPFNFTKALVKCKGKFGYIDTEGKVIIPIKYNQATNFNKEFEGNAKVTYKSKTYFINASGNPTTWKWNGKTDNTPDNKICGSKKSSTSNPVFYFDNGKKYEDWDSIPLNFLNFQYPDYNCILLAKKETGWGAISKENHHLIPFENDTLIIEQYDFYKFKKNNLWGLYSKNGKLLIEDRYSSLQILDNNLILISTSYNKKGYLSFTGKEYFRN